jgi:uncharacterized protein YutE (UPF0331/DUF86 family)
MTSVQKAVVERKLDSIRTNLADIQTIVDRGEESYVKNGLDRKVVERSLQLVIEAAVDINLHILKERFQVIPDDSAASFDQMAQQGLLPLPLAKEAAPSVGLRNRIVHEYDVLDSVRVFDGAKKALRIFPEYVRAVLKIT